MTLFATLIDSCLYLLVAATVALIVFKSIELWAPRLLGSPEFAEQAAIARSTEHWTLRLERGITVLDVIAVAAPFLGLTGTVLHIMNALALVSTSLDTAIISGPIATALKATLIGLLSAIPAGAAVTMFNRRIDVLEATYGREQP